MANQNSTNPSHDLFEQFVQAQTCKEVQRIFSELCHHLQVDPRDYQSFYTKLKERLNYWKAKSLWVKLDKRAQHQDYQQGEVCAKNKCLVLGAGPCGLRTAIELALLGAHVVVLEKRDSFSRNNVLHLWPYTIYDLRGLAAKKFYGKFCTGALDHISIRQLQLILLKVCLLLGVEVQTGVEFKGFVEPSGATGWMAKLFPDNHPAGKFQFDVFISAGGGSFVPYGFKRKELRGKLAIGITCNFLNRHTAAETQVAEISGVARIYNQKFFQDLLTETGIDLENIVYYKDDTHYFVMTAKKKSLLKMGVIKQPFWPLGTGIARGFLAAFDTAWMVRSWGKGRPHMEVLAERESIYQLLSQTTPENTSKKYSAFSIDPATRYQHVNLNSVKAFQVKNINIIYSFYFYSQYSVGAFEVLLKWCQQHTAGYDRVNVKDLNQSWRSGLALCALINTFRPRVIDMSSLEESNAVYNNQLAFNLLERELGILPIMSAREMSFMGQIDKLSMVHYLTQIHDAFNERTPTKAPLSAPKVNPDPVNPDPEPSLAPGISSNEECYFCCQRVYVLERISTEGKLFHRSCFTCHQCGTTLRLGGYTFNQHTGE
uniref:Molecule interacting with CasL protein 1 n=1 Tax=Oncorhynchus mykiss TaxID=8022 RepID=A0A8C7QM70_ONCMY